MYIRVPLGTVVTERLSDNLQNFIVSTLYNWYSILSDLVIVLIESNLYWFGDHFCYPSDAL